MSRNALIIALAWVVSPAFAAAAEPAVVPNPASLVRLAGEFRITPATVVAVDAGDAAARRIAANFADLVQRTHGLRLEVRAGAAGKGAIRLRRVPDGNALPESYRLEARPAGVVITAASDAGLVHGGMTLWQLMAPGKRSASVPAVAIDDAPRFPWRGIMLDSARHFQSPKFILAFIDWMAIHKLNVLHWHLTDDQAWRLEIRKYPRLTQVGAWRVPAGAAAQADIDPATGKPRLYGGYYSQDTVRSLVAYAADRGITIVPEIEMPGHASAAIAAYPELASVAPRSREVPADWGIYPNVVNVDESTLRFFEDVLEEVMALFPGRYIHKGGDEVQREQWRDSARVQARMVELGLRDLAALEGYFTNRMVRFLEQRGRRLVGWDEILEPGLPRSAVVMSWRGIDGALTAAARGHDTVLAPDPALYLDNRDSAAAQQPPGRIRVIASLESVYGFEPMPQALAPEQRKHVLGLEGAVWTEHIRTEERVAWSVFPRAAAIAELGWSAPEKRHWPDFVRRLAAITQRYDALGIPYSDGAFAVVAETAYGASSQRATVALSSQAKFGDIRYTLDGSEPTPSSPRYAKPLDVRVPAQVRAATFDGSRRISRPRTIPIRPGLAQHRTSAELKLCGNAVALAVEDDAPVRGQRAVFAVDILNPCWIYPGVDLERANGMVATVGQIPFNYQVGEEVKKLRFPAPATPEGELEVRLDQCEGELLARLPLAPAAASQGVTTLPRAPIAARPGRHDLCLRFAQRGVDPLWVLDSIRIEPSP